MPLGERAADAVLLPKCVLRMKGLTVKGNAADTLLAGKTYKLGVTRLTLLVNALTPGGRARARPSRSSPTPTLVAQLQESLVRRVAQDHHGFACRGGLPRLVRAHPPRGSVGESSSIALMALTCWTYRRRTLGAVSLPPQPQARPPRSHLLPDSTEDRSRNPSALQQGGRRRLNGLGAYPEAQTTAPNV